jgi:ornithine cyclodeaminase/alanine dehydrogenase-like protein (mu-crystallin family)
MSDALETTEIALRGLGEGIAINEPRHRLEMPDGVLHMLAGSVPALGAFGFKAYTSSKQGVRFTVWLYRQGTGELIAIVEADWLGKLRTGAASGVATNYLARSNAKTLGVFGAGGQAHTQILAITRVRDLNAVHVYSRRQDHLEAFCTKMTRLVQIPVTPATAEETAAQDVICTITTSREPVCHGKWLREGAHINAAGANWSDRRELDDTAVALATVIACDDLAQARQEAGDLIGPIHNGAISWEQVATVGEILAGRRPGRTDSQSITLFKSLGIGAEDVALAARVYAKAVERHVGESVRILD